MNLGASAPARRAPGGARTARRALVYFARRPGARRQGSKFHSAPSQARRRALDASRPQPAWDTELLAAFLPREAATVAAPSSTPALLPDPAALRSAERWLRRSQPVVVPTETVYGLAALARDRAGVQRVFQIKGRPADNPLIAHVADLEQARALGKLGPLAEELARSFWPGPLTLVVDARETLPWLSAGLDSIALRFPAHAFMRALIERAGPIAAPSANLSGRPSPTLASHAQADLAGLVPLIVDGGALEHGLESTVVDARSSSPRLLRPGAVTVEAIEAALGLSLLAVEAGDSARSPGMKYRHYSPRAELWVYPLPDARGAREAEPGALIDADCRRLLAEGRRVGVIAARPPAATSTFTMPTSSADVARALFDWLRRCDELALDVILIEGVVAAGVGRAVMDRLLRAASVVRRAPEPTAGHERNSR
jgi:L-threonylcarbamoyladenylate synthase